MLKLKKLLTLMLVTGIFLFASFNSGYATEVWENYTMIAAINQETCCLDITFTNNNTTEQLFFDVSQYIHPTMPVERVYVDAGDTVTFTICPPAGESIIQWFAQVGQTSLGGSIIEMITDGMQFTDISDVCGSCPNDFFTLQCTLQHGEVAILELTPCCSLIVHYCYCENKYNDKYIYITQMDVVQNCGVEGDCDQTIEDVELDPAYYLDLAWKYIAFFSIPWTLEMTPCPEESDELIIIGFPSCWTSEMHEVLVFIPGNGLLPEFGGTQDRYETRWVLNSCDNGFSPTETCSFTYTVCWNFIAGDWVPVETLIDSDIPTVECGAGCNFICE